MHSHPRDISGDDQVNFGIVPFLKFAPQKGREKLPPVMFPVHQRGCDLGCELLDLDTSWLVSRPLSTDPRWTRQGDVWMDHPSLWCRLVNVCKHIQGNAEEALDALGDQAWQNVGSWKLKIW